MHQNQLAGISDTVNGHILLKVVKGEVQKIINLAELNKLVKILRAHFIHEVLKLVF